MQIKQVEVYQFGELRQGVQEELIKKEVEDEEQVYCDGYLEEDMRVKAEMLLDEYFGEKNDIDFDGVGYDLSYGQGDNAYIRFSGLWYGEKFDCDWRGGCCGWWSVFWEGESEKRYEVLKNKIYDMNEELKRYGYDLIEYYWSDEAKEEAKETLSQSLYFEDGEIADSYIKE